MIGMSLVDSRRKNETELKRERDEEEQNDGKEDGFGKSANQRTFISTKFRSQQRS